ncbi:hypothetical protein Pcinc_018842 [Petrolisthes cinctipes]|uniref:Secreted protein n=1 Tax=Petrolisthes cinctipes TaxID=88211 RepID=A0AAE1FLR5_PETCI|nr:hypothetical protein Pcinc_018842 [Petrolisthes cinctipes]
MSGVGGRRCAVLTAVLTLYLSSVPRDVRSRLGAGGAVAAGGEDPVGCGPALEFLVSHKVASRDHLARLPDGGECL